MDFVDYALIAPDPEEGSDPPTVRLLKALHPNVFATADERHSDYQESLHKQGIRVCYVEPVRMTSTTQIIQVILQRYNRGHHAKH